MSLLLIDDQGELWRGDSRRLRETFDSPYSGGEFVDYAVKNLGFVAINDYGASCQARLRPGFVTEKAFEVLKGYLQRPRIARVVLTKFENGWQDELVQGSNAARRLEEVLKPAAGVASIRPKDFLCAPLPGTVLNANPVLSDVFEGWQHLVQNYDTDTVVKLLRTVFSDRYVIVGKGKNDRLLFQTFGEKMFPQYETWRNCAIGAPIEETPDRAYGRWISEAQREVIDSPDPRLDAVDAIIRCPVRGRVRIKYRRLILPLVQDSGGSLTITGSFDDPTIDLRIPAR